MTQKNAAVAISVSSKELLRQKSVTLQRHEIQWSRKIYHSEIQPQNI